MNKLFFDNALAIVAIWGLSTACSQNSVSATAGSLQTPSPLISETPQTTYLPTFTPAANSTVASPTKTPGYSAPLSFLWGVNKPEIPYRLLVPTEPLDLVFSSDSTLLAAVYCLGDRTAYSSNPECPATLALIWDVNSQTLIQTIGPIKDAARVLFDPSGRKLITVGFHEISLWNVSDASEISTAYETRGSVDIFKPIVIDGEQIVYALKETDTDRTLGIASRAIADGSTTLLIESSNQSAMLSFAISRDGGWFAISLCATADVSNCIDKATTEIRDRLTGQLIKTLATQHVISFSPNSTRLLTDDRDDNGNVTATIWETADWRPVTRFAAGQSAATYDFSADGRYLAIGLWDQEHDVEILDMLVNSIFASQKTSGFGTPQVRISPNGQYVLVNSFSSTWTLQLLNGIYPETVEQVPQMTPVPWPSFTPHPYVASTQQRSPKDDMAMVYVPPGLFLMGSNTQDDTTPEHEVSLDGYWVDQTEVTNAMYRRCVDSGLCSLPEQIDASIYPKNYFYDPIYNNYPVAALTWYQAATYCKWADRRLLTEAEWEKAARGTDHRIYAWGDTDPFDVFELVLANFAINDFGGVTEVGRFPAGASPYGALDMAGNVAEWVSDWYEPDYYSKALSQNPQGPSDGEYKVLRGGGISGDGSIDMILTYYRDLAKPDEPIGGVRCGHSIWQ